MNNSDGQQSDLPQRVREFLEMTREITGEDSKREAQNFFRFKVMNSSNLESPEDLIHSYFTAVAAVLQSNGSEVSQNIQTQPSNKEKLSDFANNNFAKIIETIPPSQKIPVEVMRKVGVINGILKAPGWK